MSDVFLSSDCFKSYLSQLPLRRGFKDLVVELVVACCLGPTIEVVVVAVGRLTNDVDGVSAPTHPLIARVVRVDSHSHAQVLAWEVFQTNTINDLVTNHRLESILLARFLDSEVIEPLLFEVGILRSGG